MLLVDKNIKELAKDLTYLAGASNLQTDEDFTQAYREELGKQLIEDLKDEKNANNNDILNAIIDAKMIEAQFKFSNSKSIFKKKSNA